MSADHEFDDGGKGGTNYCWAHVSTFGNGDCGRPRSSHPPAQVVEADDECACGKLRSAHDGGTGRAYDITGNKFCGGFSPAPPTDPARKGEEFDRRCEGGKIVSYEDKAGPGMAYCWTMEPRFVVEEQSVVRKGDATILALCPTKRSADRVLEALRGFDPARKPADGRSLPGHAVMWAVVNGRVCRKQHTDNQHEWESITFAPSAGPYAEPAPTPEKPADEDEAAAREWLRDLVKSDGLHWDQGRERFNDNMLDLFVKRHAAALARFRATAREQGHQAGRAEVLLLHEAEAAKWVKAVQGARQAGAEEMREACAKATCPECEKGSPLVSDAPYDVHEESPSLPWTRCSAAYIRALPLPEPRS